MSEIGNKKIFAANLRYYMTINEKDRNQVCQDLGFKYSSFTNWYNGIKYPRIDKIEMLANYFHIQKSDLIERHTEKSKVIEDKLKSLSPENREKALEYIHFLNMLENKQAIEKDNSLDFRKEA